MRFNPNLLEWFFIVGLVMVTVIEYILLAGGLIASPEITLLNMNLLIIFAGELLLGILLLKIYVEINKIKVVKK